jgi:hypothetical protein
VGLGPIFSYVYLIYLVYCKDVLFPSALFYIFTELKLDCVQVGSFLDPLLFYFITICLN